MQIKQHIGILLLAIAFFVVVPIERLHHCHAKAAANACELHDEDGTHVESDFPDCEVFHQHIPPYLSSWVSVPFGLSEYRDFHAYSKYEYQPSFIYSHAPPRAPPV